MYPLLVWVEMNSGNRTGGFNSEAIQVRIAFGYTALFLVQTGGWSYNVNGPRLVSFKVTI